MPNFKRFPNEGFPYFVTTTVKDRRPLFTDPVKCQVLLDCLKFLRSASGHKIHAYVIMPDHVHLIVTPKIRKTISQVMHSFKIYTSRQIGLLTQSTGGIWQPRFYERALQNGEEAQNALDYIHVNPVRSGLVSNPVEYQWSSYRACTRGEPIPIEVDLLEC